MSEKAFGIKKIEIKGSGIPVLSSPTDINLNAVTVAIGTDLSIGGKVVSNLIVGDGYYVGIGSTNPTNALTVAGSGTSTSQLYVTGFSTFSGPVYEKVTNNFNTSLIPAGGVLSIDVSSSPIIVGALSASVTTWSFVGVNTSTPSAVTVSLIIDSNSLYTYGDGCRVNNNSITNGIRWSGGIAPVSTNNEDILSFTIITDSSNTVRVYGSSTLNYT